MSGRLTLVSILMVGLRAPPPNEFRTDELDVGFEWLIDAPLPFEEPGPLRCMDRVGCGGGEACISATA